jgi:hypothetical protein
MLQISGSVPLQRYFSRSWFGYKVIHSGFDTFLFSASRGLGRHGNNRTPLILDFGSRISKKIGRIGDRERGLVQRNFKKKLADIERRW